jgi:Kef-type K+ transport system membrane component KefB
MTLLLLQMSVVLLVTLICGWLARKLGQTRVIGEIIGGILIGPSVLGRFFPSVAHSFTPHSFAAFENLSTVGLILCWRIRCAFASRRTALAACPSCFSWASR